MSAEHVQLERLIEVGRRREAEQLLGQLLAAQPSDPALHCLGAQLALDCDDLPRAGEHVERALALAPGHFTARLLLYDVQYRAKRYGEAEQTITSLIREQPESAGLLAIYARLLLVTLHLEKAGALAAEALRRAPDDPTARTVQVLLLTLQRRHGDAGEQLAALIREDPGNASTVYTLFSVLVAQRRHREALAVGRQLLRLDPDNHPLIEALAELRAASHWLAWPLYPLQRWGWAGSAALWALSVLAFSTLARSGASGGGWLALLWLGYCVYSWVYPPLSRRWLLRKGF